MNYQNKTDNILEASTELECPVDMLDYFAFPKSFPTTSGPFSKEGVVSGQAISSFTIEAYTDGRDAVLFCKGRRWKRVDKWYEHCVDIMFGRWC